MALLCTACRPAGCGACEKTTRARTEEQDESAAARECTSTLGTCAASPMREGALQGEDEGPMVQAWRRSAEQIVEDRRARSSSSSTAGRSTTERPPSCPEPVSAGAAGGRPPGAHATAPRLFGAVQRGRQGMQRMRLHWRLPCGTRGARPRHDSNSRRRARNSRHRSSRRRLHSHDGRRAGLADGGQ